MLPDLSDVVDSFSQPLTLIEVTQEVVNYKPVNVEVETQIDAVIQVADPDKIMNDKVDLSKRYLQVHTRDILKNTDICIYQDIRYKAFLINNYSDYGYYEAYFEETKSA